MFPGGSLSTHTGISELDTGSLISSQAPLLSAEYIQSGKDVFPKEGSAASQTPEPLTRCAFHPFLSLNEETADFDENLMI